MHMPTYEYERPAVSTDIAVVCGGETPRILLVLRGRDPFAGRWALPGGFVDPGERLEDAARRELAEETGLILSDRLIQVGAYGDPGRDPRGWTVTVLFAVGLEDACEVAGGDDAAEARWHPIDELPPLAFDHDRLVADALASFGVTP